MVQDLALPRFMFCGGEFGFRCRTVFIKRLGHELTQLLGSFVAGLV